MQDVLKKSAIVMYKNIIAMGNFSQSILLLIFRLYWGWQFFITGKGKLLDHSKIVEFFSSLHIPYPGFNAWFVGGLECFGGLLLLLGLCSRPTALLLTISMTAAYLAVPDDRAKVLNVIHDPDKFLAADPFFFLLTSLLIFCFGPGPVSLDWLLHKRFADKPQDGTTITCQQSEMTIAGTSK